MLSLLKARYATPEVHLGATLAKRSSTGAFAMFVIVLSSLATLAQAEVTRAQMASLQLPEGFVIELLTDQVPNARQMALSASGTLFVGTRSKGNVYAIANALAQNPDLPPDLNNPADKPTPISTPLQVTTIAKGLTLPSGLVMHGDDLLVGAVDKILRFTDIEQHLRKVAPYTIVTQDLPAERHHGWKYLSIGPDGFLYVPVGAPCNICKSSDPRFASVLRVNPDNGVSTIYAAGIRNTVGLAWHPQTQQLWFSENGRDMLGDDIPPEEINRVTVPGQHFGYPYIHAGTLSDPQFGQDANPAEYQHPVANFQAHSAPLGITFYEGEQFPPEYRNTLFIAEHGSWNRSEKVGYRVSLLHTNASLTGSSSQGSNSQGSNTQGAMQQAKVEPFLSGWLSGQDSWGRPNDVLVTPNGSLLISDDKAGAIYRVTYKPTP